MAKLRCRKKQKTPILIVKQNTQIIQGGYQIKKILKRIFKQKERNNFIGIKPNFLHNLIRINRKQIKLNKQKMRNFQETAQNQYILAKFEPNNILLINRHTKQSFNYFQLQNISSLFQQLKHPYLLRPLFYGNGLLYPKSNSNLMIELQNRKRAFDKQLFTEAELTNTFLPLFQCLYYLHQNNVVHGQIHPENIVFVDGKIKLRDWLVYIKENFYYSEQKRQNLTKFDDYAALGQIIMQYATLRKSSSLFEQKDINSDFQPIIDVYSKNFIFLLLILLKKKTEFFKDLTSLVQSKQSVLIQNSELNALYAKIKSQKTSKAIKPQPIDKIFNIVPTLKKPQNQNLIFQSSPNKKFSIVHTTNKKLSQKLDDTQNKKIFNQEVKKRQIQKITKIIERSNAFVNELMARKNNSQFGALKSNSEYNGGKNEANQHHVLKKISGKNNVNLGGTVANSSMYNAQPVKKVKQITTSIIFSPNKRMRTISRKK